LRPHLAGVARRSELELGVTGPFADWNFIMPQKAHRQTGGALTRHSRSTSGGSSKIGLNLHFTQKDPLVPKLQEKAKKNGVVHDVCHHKYVNTHFPSVLTPACLLVLVSAKNNFALPESK
jgi:hypothetical protein